MDSFKETLSDEKKVEVPKYAQETDDDTKQIETVSSDQPCESTHQDQSNSQTYFDDKAISSDSNTVVQHCNKDVPLPTIANQTSTDNTTLTNNNVHVSTSSVSMEVLASRSSSTFSTLSVKNTIPASAFIVDTNISKKSEQTGTSGSPSYVSSLNATVQEEGHGIDKESIDVPASTNHSDSLTTDDNSENEIITSMEVTENLSVTEQNKYSQVSHSGTNLTGTECKGNHAESEMTEKRSDIFQLHCCQSQNMNSTECNNRTETSEADSQDAQSRDFVDKLSAEMFVNDKLPDTDHSVIDSNIINQAYRSDVALVNYSDSEDSSSSESGKESLNNDHDAGPDSELKTEAHNEKNMKKAELSQSSVNSRLRSNGEIFPEELPPIDYLTISAPEEVELVQLGTVSGIVDILVVIKALQATPALYDDSVLFLENRQPLGLIFETLGTVEQPFYSVRFNSAKDIKEKEICIGDKIMFAPKADNLTKYIFISELRKIKCDDASWEFDNEPPTGVKDFSDDEEERKAKKGKKASNLKRKKPAFERHLPSDARDQRPALKQGDLHRNPFGNQSQKFGTKPNSNWTTFQKADHLQQRGNGSRHPQASNSQMSQTTFQFQGNNTQPNVSFGGQPAWLNQSTLIRSQGVMGAFPRGMGPGSFNGNQPSFQGFQQNSNAPIQPFNVSSSNQGIRPPAFPFPDFTRLPPPGMTGFRPTNPVNTRPFFVDGSSERPGHGPPFSTPFFSPFSGSANAPRFSQSRPPHRRP